MSRTAFGYPVQIMAREFEVSFNSPQCGWMSIGFEHEGAEFHTTTAAVPHRNALSEMLTMISQLLVADEGFSKTLKWNRDPEEYDFLFKKDGRTAAIEIIEYPTFERESGESVYRFEGDPAAIAKAFVTTFEQMFEERDIDEFEENWHQAFPVEAFENLKTAVRSYG